MPAIVPWQAWPEHHGDGAAVTVDTWWRSSDRPSTMPGLIYRQNVSRTHCKRKHAYREHGIVRADGRQQCRLCRAASNRRRQQRPGLAIAGESTAVRRARRAWITKRERYGESGMSAAARAKMQIVGRLSSTATRPPLSRCKRGHELTPDNLYWYGRRRWCKKCARLRQRGRPEWIETDRGRVSLIAHDRFYVSEFRRLKFAMIAAHPDAGGRSTMFIKAKKAFDRFREEQAEWYAAAKWRPPRVPAGGWTRRRGAAPSETECLVKSA